MKRFIVIAVVFLIGLAALNGIVYVVIAPFVEGDAYAAKVRSIDPETRGVVLADSHGTRLDDQVLRSAGIANLSSGSDSYLDMLNKLKYSLDRYPMIKLVILTVDGHCMSKYREYTNNLDKSALLGGGIGFKAAVRRYVPLLDPKGRDFFKGASLAWLERAMKPKEAAATAAALAEPSLAWKDKPNKKELAARRAETQFKFAQPSELLRETLKEIVSICTKRGVTLVGIKYPLASDYLLEIKGKDYGAAAVLTNLGVAVLDYEDLYMSRDDLFEDQDHLNKVGGTMFARLILDKLSKRGLY